jgi:hypothetical protein
VSDPIIDFAAQTELALEDITRAAGHIERLLHLSKSTQWVDSEN